MLPRSAWRPSTDGDAHVGWIRRRFASTTRYGQTHSRGQILTTSPVAAPAPAKRSSLAPGIVTFVLGFVVGVGCLVTSFVTVIAPLTDLHSHQVPGSFTVNCHSGGYVIYQDVGAATGSGDGVNGNYPASSQYGRPALSAGDVSVTDTDGRSAAVHDYSSSTTSTITIGGRTYSAAATFNAPASGNYRVQVSGTGATAVVVARSFSSLLYGAVPWIVGAGVGLLTGIVGVTLFIVALVGRSQAKKRAMQGPGGYPWPGTPPGGFPPPVGGDTPI